jgi:hypothetical protein
LHCLRDLTLNLTLTLTLPLTLTLTQRFGDAIAHLWQAGKFLPAVHVTVACLHYGLILPHQVRVRVNVRINLKPSVGRL